MLFGESGALLRPLSRRLAGAGWLLAAVGIACGLAVAVGSGVRLSRETHAIQAAGLTATVASALLLLLAVFTQPSARRTGAEKLRPSNGSARKEQARSFLLAAVVMLVAVAGFAAAGWTSSTGPSPQSGAFSQVFLLGAVDCGLTFLLLNKPGSGNAGS
ncbi:hypothetical protein BIU82_10190 [Arthrobacter sp. SW1]|uniref:hypothetical protein n=1 Tax=Arthrobacter sp. SW1 TaxID=1920889 RepID=UPI000877D22B|nr:hypothetical protein [Arthrobacter sp. SW1]OFI37421.1 hypothetical protein BIU82_10190 [Arthrobacter sp. SW1]